MFENMELVLLVAAGILLVSIILTKVGYRFGLPALLLFLGVGMLFGSDGLGIQFNDPKAVQFIGMLALTMILFLGGMDTKVADIKPVAKQGVVLATLGVLLTTFITGTFIYYLALLVEEYITLTYPEALLLAAVMSSTDSASVFSLLGNSGVKLKERLRPLLELESGSNDPMAYLLTLILIAYIQAGGMSVGTALFDLVTQLVIGAVGGYFFGRFVVGMANRINLSNESLYPILIMTFAFLAFSAVTLCHGNGYLAAYIAGMKVGNSPIVHKKRIATFFDGFVWLWQIVMFIILGLLVNPHELLPVAGIGVLIGVFMIIFARPLSVFLCLLPDKSFSFKGKLYISWVGLRGAVPIIFATYPVIAGVEHAGVFFNIVFFITILSLLIQGTTVTFMARELGLVDKNVQESVFDLDLPENIKSALSEIVLTPEVLKHGNKLINLRLPEHSLAAMVERDGHYFIPRGQTELKAGDRLLVISDNDKELLEAYNKLDIKEYTLKKN